MLQQIELQFSQKLTCSGVGLAEKQLSYNDACAELKKMYDEKSADAPRVKHLLRVTFAERQKAITSLPDGDVTEIFKLFPHLKEMQHVCMVMSCSFFSVNMHTFIGVFAKLTALCCVCLLYTSPSPRDS